MNNPLTVLAGEPGKQVFPLFVHAHPDDETLQTGALLAWLSANDITCEVVTCTRGEQGEVVSGVLPTEITAADLARVRQRELSCALDALGSLDHDYLGTPPARANGLQPRDYRDSGMRWVSEGVAGPAELHDPDTFTAADLPDLVADLRALIDRVQPTVLVSYDEQGSYGHPDHVRAHELTLATSKATGIPMVEVASTPDAEGFEWFDLSDQRDAVVTALTCYQTQLTVADDHLVHVGGQHQDLPLRIGLRRVE